MKDVSDDAADLPARQGDRVIPRDAARARVLLAVDDADMRDDVRRLLEPRWTVEAVADGAQALAAARERPPDLVLTDVLTPGLDGLALLRRLREDERTRGVPVIMLSARADPEAALEGLEAGAEDYLIKPFSARELLARVRLHLELARLRREAQTRLAEAERALGFSHTFLGMLGHDLRNPLGAIVTSADVLLRREPDERVARPAARIRSSAQRMARMIDQLLDFTRARIGAGIPLHPTPVDLSRLAAPLVEELEPGAPKRVQIEVQGDPRGEWDPDRLAQVLSNLLGNALEHGDPAAPVHLRIDGTDPQRVELRVENAGAIPAELLPTLFDPFRRAAGARRTEKSRGLGLGLFVVEQVVQAHGGRIEVSSSPEEGTSFRLSLPRGAPPDP